MKRDDDLTVKGRRVCPSDRPLRFHSSVSLILLPDSAKNSLPLNKLSDLVALVRLTLSECLMMTKLMRSFVLLISVASVVAVSSCSQRQNQSTTTNTEANMNTTTPVPEKKTKATGSITANPNPIKVCDGTGTGVTSLTWLATGTTLVEVRMGSPNGAVFAQTGPSGGTKITGKWVGNGAVAYLQDASDGKPATSDYTIATVTLLVTTQGCP